MQARSERPISRLISWVRPPTRPLHRLPLAAGVGGRGQHRVLGGQPAQPGALAPARHALGDAGRAQHLGVAELDQHRSRWMLLEATGDRHRPQLVVGPSVSSRHPGSLCAAARPPAAADPPPDTVRRDGALVHSGGRMSARTVSTAALAVATIVLAGCSASLTGGGAPEPARTAAATAPGTAAAGSDSATRRPGGGGRPVPQRAGPPGGPDAAAGRHQGHPAGRPALPQAGRPGHHADRGVHPDTHADRADQPLRTCSATRAGNRR